MPYFFKLKTIEYVNNYGYNEESQEGRADQSAYDCYGQGGP